MTLDKQGSLVAMVAWCFVAGCNTGDAAGGAQPAVAQSALAQSAVAQSAVAQSALAHADCATPNPELFPKDSHPFGASMETWAERWWSWAWKIPFATNPNFDPTLSCDVDQDGPMFFLPHLLTGASTVARSCTIPRHKAIAVTVASVFNDYPCPDPTFHPAPGQSLFDFLIGPAKEGQDHVASIDAALDGHPIADVMSYRVASDDVFQFTGDLSLQQIDNCVTGAPQPGVVDSFFIVLKPLPRGTHTLTVTTHSIFGTVFGPRLITLNVE